MIAGAVRTFRAHPDYLVLSLVTFLSGLGGTLTVLAIYRKLARLGASPLVYGFAFAFMILPGILTSQIGVRYLERFDVARVMIAVECIGCLALALPLHGSRANAILPILGGIPIASAAVGFLIPFTNVYVRSKFTDDEMVGVADVTNAFLVFDFLFGTLLGTFLIERVPVVDYFVFDAITYVLTAVGIAALARRFPRSFRGFASDPEDSADASRTIPFSWRALSPRQKRAFLIYPMLAAACSPCAALLAGAGDGFSSPAGRGWLLVSPALLLLLAKSGGQALGPWAARAFDFDSGPRLTRLLAASLGGFLALYAFAFASRSLALAALAVLFAHVLSNLVFTISFIEFKRGFSVAEIGPASARQFQIGSVVMAIGAVGNGALANVYGNQVAVFFGAVGFVVSLVLLKLNAKENRKEGPAHA